MKTRVAHKDERTAIEEKKATEEHRRTQMESAAGGRPISEESAKPRKLFGMRVSQGSSVFKLLFPG
jgi:hypothetical protein